MSKISGISLVILATACSGGRRTTSGATLEGTVQGPTALRVEVPGTAASTQTDASGHFAMLNVPAGESEVHFSGPGVDATLHIAALSKREHRNISVSVSGHEATEHHEASEVELRGAIESIAAPSLVVGGKTVVTTTATQFQKAGVAIAFADLSVGEAVEAEGALQQDGSLLARSVKVEDAAQADDEAGDEGPEDVTFEGALNAAADGKLTVGTTTVTTSATTRIEKGDQAVAVSALAIGDELRVEGALQQDGSVAASEIHVLSAEEEAEVQVAGAVTAVSAADQTITSGTTTVRIDDHTQFSGEGTFASLADVQVGDLLDVEAAAQADGTLLAAKVERLGEPEINEIEVKGAIEVLGAASIQVQGKSFLVDAATRIELSGNALQLSSLKVGQIADVRGMIGSDSALHATRISVEN